MEDRPASAPDGAEALPGVIEIYAAYDATKAVVKGGGEASAGDWAAYDAACVQLREARRYWREIRTYVHAAQAEEVS